MEMPRQQQAARMEKTTPPARLPAQIVKALLRRADGVQCSECGQHASVASFIVSSSSW